MVNKVELPIFRTEVRRPETGDLMRAAESLFRISDNFTLDESKDAIVLESRTHAVELAHSSGGIWAADNTRLFNPDLKPNLPSLEKSTEIAKNFSEDSHLLPKLGGSASWGETIVAGTRLATLTGRTREERELDHQFIFPVLVEGLPVVGGGGDFTLVLGEAGEIIGFHGVWRELADSFLSRAISSDEAEDTYKKSMDAAGMQLESLTSYVAYFASPASDEQEFLYPVHVLGGTAVVGKERVPLRMSLLPATEFGPKTVVPPPERKRPPTTKPGPKSSPELEDSHLTPRRRRGYALSSADGLSTSTRAMTSNPFEAGASWIGVSGGLDGSKKNAKGFSDGLKADGWNINFNWGDANAFESDWRRDNDTMVDAADFVFYTGHASMNGWMLAEPDDTFLHFNEVGPRRDNPGDMWGQNDLEWIVVAACGPLQDALLSTGGGDVLSRWGGAFDGLHQLMGYGSVTYDNETEGRSLVKYARQGKTLRNAWFRTSKETQPATNKASAPDGPIVWTGIMWASKSGANPADDHAWGHGSVSADPVSPTSLHCMWTVC